MSYFNPDAIMRMLADSARYNAAVMGHVEMVKQAKVDMFDKAIAQASQPVGNKKQIVANLFKDNRNELVYGVVETPVVKAEVKVKAPMQDFQQMMDKMVILKPINSFAVNANALSKKIKAAKPVKAKSSPQEIHGVTVYDDPKVISMFHYQRKVHAA